MLVIVSLCLPWNGQVSFSRIGRIGESQGLELDIFITVIPRSSSVLKEELILAFLPICPVTVQLLTIASQASNKLQG